MCQVRESTRLCDQPIGIAEQDVLPTAGYRRKDGSNCVFKPGRTTAYHTCDAPLCDGCTYEMWNTLTPRFDDTWDQCPWHAHREERHDFRMKIDAFAAEKIRKGVRFHCRKAAPKPRLVPPPDTDPCR